VKSKLSFESVSPNDKLPEVTRYITQEDIWRFAASSLDCNVVHVNPEWCKRTKVFGETTVMHGGLTSSLIMTVLINWAYPLGGKIAKLEIKLIKPVPPNSTLIFGGLVTEKHPIGKGEDFVVIELYGKNQDEEKIAIGKAEVMLP